MRERESGFATRGREVMPIMVLADLGSGVTNSQRVVVDGGGEQMNYRFIYVVK